MLFYIRIEMLLKYEMFKNIDKMFKNIKCLKCLKI